MSVSQLMKNQLRTPEEAAHQLGLTNSNTLAVWRCTKRYDLEFVRVGRLIRYKQEAIDRFIEENTVRTGDAA